MTPSEFRAITTAVLTASELILQLRERLEVPEEDTFHTVLDRTEKAITFAKAVLDQVKHP